MNDRIYKTKREKYNAVIEEIVQLTEAGRPVLVGTTSVEISELLSRMLTMRKIQHNVLNAKLHQKEAEIVAWRVKRVRLRSLPTWPVVVPISSCPRT